MSGYIILQCGFGIRIIENIEKWLVTSWIWLLSESSCWSQWETENSLPWIRCRSTLKSTPSSIRLFKKKSASKSVRKLCIYMHEMCLKSARILDMDSALKFLASKKDLMCTYPNKKPKQGRLVLWHCIGNLWCICRHLLQPGQQAQIFCFYYLYIVRKEKNSSIL